MKLADLVAVRRSWLPLLLLMLAVKIVLVLSLTDVFFYCEELEKGTAAKAMIDGLPVPHHQLAYHYYEGGGFVISHLKALAFLLVGENLLAHKLVALVFNVAILLAGWSFTRRLFGGPAAVWFGLLFTFGPESFQKLSLISLGIHFEACLFLLGVLGLGARLLFAREERWPVWAALGLVTGFGLYFSYQIAVAATYLVLLLLVFRTRALLGRSGLWAILGTAVGAAPLIVMYFLVGDLVFDIHGTSLSGDDSLPSNATLFGQFLSSIFLEGVLGDRIAPFAAVTAAAGALAVLFTGRGPGERARKLRAAFVLGYPLLFLATYLCSGFVQGWAWHFYMLFRVVPLWLFGAVLVAAALGKLGAAEGAKSRHLALVAGAAVLFLGVRASALVLATGHPELLAENWRILTRTKGYSYDQYFSKVLWHFEGTPEEKLELVEAFDEDARTLLRADAVSNLFRDPVPDLATALERADEAFHAAGLERVADYQLGLGPLLVIGHGWDQARAVAAAAATEPPRRDTLLEALGRFGGGSYPLEDPLHAEVARGLELEDREAFLRGVGRFLYRRYRIDPTGAEAFLEAQPGPARASLREGFEAARKLHTL